MSSNLLERLGKNKLIQAAAIASFLSYPAMATAKENYSINPENKYVLNLSEEGINKDYFNLETKLASTEEEEKPDYLKQWEKGKEWEQEQKWREEEREEKEKKSKGCGTTCAVIGGVIAGVCGAVLIGLYNLDKETEGGTDAYSRTVQEDKKSTGPILFGIGTVGGLGLMIYGLATME